MRLAVIDLGTNTFTLILVAIKEGKHSVIYKSKVAVKLGEDGINEGKIGSEAYKRGLKAIEQHKKDIESFQIDKVIAFATSAIRSTSNGEEFTNEVYKKFGIKIEIINGDKEAELIYHGVKQAFDLGKHNSLIMDIGGGSTEFIIANNEQVFWKQSFQLGVSRLKEKFKPNDPIKQTDINNLLIHFDKELINLIEAVSIYKPITLIGSSGSFDSLAAMISHKYFDKDVLFNNTEFTFERDGLKWANQYLMESDYKKRINTKGISKMRAKMIVIAMIFIKYIIDKTTIKEVKLSTYSLKEGVIYEETNRLS
jgi:exopolyphosphatase/guanosine-5'-triphosphate,3'-diphosphate pyrophosphatase